MKTFTMVMVALFVMSIAPSFSFAHGGHHNEHHNKVVHILNHLLNNANHCNNGGYYNGGYYNNNGGNYNNGGYYNNGGCNNYQPPPPVYYQKKYGVVVRNNSGRCINVAVCYNDGCNWRVRGWWSLDPGESANLGRLSTNTNLYLYAECGDGTTWGGDTNTTVCSQAFNIVDGEGDRTVGFQQAYVAPGTNYFSYSFNP